MAPKNRKLTVGYLLPRVLVILCILDVLLRVAEVGFGAFKGPQAIPVSNTPGVPFESNISMQLPVVYGDLASMANRRDASETRSMQFSTDALGFRATGATGPVKGILFGDSFSWSGDKDEYSFPAQLGQQLGCRIYNAAGPGYESRRPAAAYINAVAKRVGLDDGLIVVTELERRFFERLQPERRVRARGETFWTRAQDFYQGLVRASPIKRYMERLLKYAHDDRILPNAYVKNVVDGKLRNGERMSFLPDDLRPASKARPVPIDYWATLYRDLQKSGRKLLVVIVPNKYTVYQPLLQDRQQLPEVGEELTDRYESALQALGIPVINLTRTFKARAAAGIDRREYVYWRNDTHWNKQGVRIAAEEIVRAFPKLKDLCSYGEGKKASSATGPSRFASHRRHAAVFDENSNEK